MPSPRVLITCADQYMGPAIHAKFTVLGYEVIASTAVLSDEAAVQTLVDDTLAGGAINVVIANLAEPPALSPVQDIANADWQRLFAVMVDPLMYLVRAVTPSLLERKSGKIIAVTSAAPLRGIPNGSAYCAARGAQNAFVKAVGMELARNNIQVNAIGQNYINNNTYFPDDILANPKFIDHIKRNVPTGQIGAAEETAELAAYLASENCKHMVGQVLPLAGGWVT
ncbi:MAG: SDR family oxidoreductase [Gammaproteobacteria bacterium]